MGSNKITKKAIKVKIKAVKKANKNNLKGRRQLASKIDDQAQYSS